MLHATLPARLRLRSRICACALLLGLSACDAEPSDDAAADFRADELDLESLERGECVALPDSLEQVRAEKWTLSPGTPSIIVEDNVMYMYIVIEDDIMLRVGGSASVDDLELAVATATATYDDPELANDCGFCDGLCVDGKCLMNLPPFVIAREGICRE